MHTYTFITILPFPSGGGVATSNNQTYTFNGHFYGITRVSRYQKGKTNLDFTEARDNEW